MHEPLPSLIDAVMQAVIDKSMKSLELSLELPDSFTKRPYAAAHIFSYHIKTCEFSNLVNSGSNFFIRFEKYLPNFSMITQLFHTFIASA